MSALSDTLMRRILIACNDRLAYRVDARRVGGDMKEIDMQSHREHRIRMRLLALWAATLAATTLAACGKPGEPQTVGDKIGAAVSQVEQKATEVSDSVKSTATEAIKSTENAAGEIGDKVKDAAITTAVNAKLSQDGRLSVLRINVDTVNGHVALRGSAPDAAARDRAQQLASSVEGVISVDNLLVVGGKG